MKRFFAFNGTISGSTFLLRILFSIVLSIPFIIILTAMLSSIVFSYMDIDFANANGMSMAESNTIGEEAGLKIAEEMMEIGPMAWFSQNISIIWIIAAVISLIPLIWFSLATYYKRISAIFYLNRVKAFFAFIAAEATLDIIGLTYGDNSVYWICALISFAIFAFLLFSNGYFKNIIKNLEKNNLRIMADLLVSAREENYPIYGQERINLECSGLKALNNGSGITIDAANTSLERFTLAREICEKYNFNEGARFMNNYVEVYKLYIKNI